MKERIQTIFFSSWCFIWSLLLLRSEKNFNFKDESLGTLADDIIKWNGRKINKLHVILSLNGESQAFFSFFSLSVRFIFLLPSLSLLFYFSLVQEHFHFLHSPMQYSCFSTRIASVSPRHSLFLWWHDMPTDINPVSFSPTNPRKCMQVLKVVSFIIIIMYVLKTSFFSEH